MAQLLRYWQHVMGELAKPTLTAIWILSEIFINMQQKRGQNTSAIVTRSPGEWENTHTEEIVRKLENWLYYNNVTHCMWKHIAGVT